MPTAIDRDSFPCGERVRIRSTGKIGIHDGVVTDKAGQYIRVKVGDTLYKVTVSPHEPVIDVLMGPHNPHNPLSPLSEARLLLDRAAYIAYQHDNIALENSVRKVAEEVGSIHAHLEKP